MDDGWRITRMALMYIPGPCRQSVHRSSLVVNRNGKKKSRNGDKVDVIEVSTLLNNFIHLVVVFPTKNGLLWALALVEDSTRFGETPSKKNQEPVRRQSDDEIIQHWSHWPKQEPTLVVKPWESRVFYSNPCPAASILKYVRQYLTQGTWYRNIGTRVLYKRVPLRSAARDEGEEKKREKRREL